jgi:hypothetical protein
LGGTARSLAKVNGSPYKEPLLSGCQAESITILAVEIQAFVPDLQRHVFPNFVSGAVGNLPGGIGTAAAGVTDEECSKLRRYLGE